jgi:predicted lipoprotein with Yx(FWY)xxD motif
MKNSLSRLALAAAALTLPIVAVSPATSYATTASAQPAKVALSRSALGSILVDSQGRTLYLFERTSETAVPAPAPARRTGRRY